MSLSVCCPPNNRSNTITPTMADCLTVTEGMDLEGNSFWEIPVSAHGRVRRIVAYKDPKRDLVAAADARWNSKPSLINAGPRSPADGVLESNAKPCDDSAGRKK